MRESRLYARGIVPFFVLFSVVVLRVDLVLVSVVSGDISPLTGGGGSRTESGSEEKAHEPDTTLPISRRLDQDRCWFGTEG
jgi:hypothetical protein